MTAERGSMRLRDRVFAAVLALAIAVGGAVVAFFALLIRGFACFEGCDPSSGRWQDDPDAWQWTAERLLAGGVFVAALVAGGLIVAGWRRGWSAAFLTGVVLLAAWLGLMGT